MSHRYDHVLNEEFDDFESRIRCSTCRLRSRPATPRPSSSGHRREIAITCRSDEVPLPRYTVRMYAIALAVIALVVGIVIVGSRYCYRTNVPPPSSLSSPLSLVRCAKKWFSSFFRNSHGRKRFNHSFLTKKRKRPVHATWSIFNLFS